MAYDLEEQEQLASLKAWWSQYGNLISWVLIIALAAYAGWMYFENSKRTNSQQASQLYEEMNKAMAAKDVAKVTRAATDIQTRFANTNYAPMASLIAAKASFDANDLKTSKTQLQWVIEHSKEAEFLALAKIRLAGVLLDEKAYDEALKQLAGEFPSQFNAQVLDRKGDILFAQNKIAEARSAFEQALSKVDEKHPMRQLIQIKLDAVGGASAKAA